VDGWVVPLEALSRSDVARAGGKGANLGELLRAGLSVPPGFVVTAQAFLQALEQGGVRAAIRSRMEGLPEGAAESYRGLSTELQGMVRKAGLPARLRSELVEAYGRLGRDAPVAVRSSATSEDAASTSFAGMHETFTQVVGVAALEKALLGCWASAYGPRVLAREGLRVLSVRVGQKAKALVVDREGRERRLSLDAEARTRCVLTDDECVQLARMGLEVERHQGAPQDVEWAEEAGRFWLVQTRPITTLSEPSGMPRRAWPPAPCACCATRPKGTPSSRARCWWPP